MQFTVSISQRLKKLVRSLRQKKYRDQNRLFLAEGEKLCKELLDSKYEPELILVKESANPEARRLSEQFADKGVAIYSATKNHFDQVCSTKTPQDILAVAHMNDDPLKVSEPFIALDGVSDPGNVGTIIRCADWFGVKQVIFGKDCADKYNTKLVRSTMGSIFRVSALYAPNLADFISNNFSGFDIYGANEKAAKPLEECRPSKKFGLIFGAESRGIAENLADIVGTEYSIKGYGEADSLNVAASVGISLYHFVHLSKKT